MKTRYTIVDIAKAILRRRKLVLISGAAGALVGFVLSVALPAVGVTPFVDQYRYVARSTVIPLWPSPPVREVLKFDVNFMTLALLTDPVAHDTVANRVATPGETSPDYRVHGHFNQRENTITVTIETTDRAFAERFVSELVLYARNRVGQRVEGTLELALQTAAVEELTEKLDAEVLSEITDDELRARLDDVITAFLAERSLGSPNIPWSEPVPYTVQPKQRPVLAREPAVAIAFFAGVGFFFAVLMVFILDYISYLRKDEA